MNNAFSVAIAIDFGTTFSGYAYCFAAHSATGEIYKNTEWTKQVHQKNSYIKTPTHLLYNNGALEAWGYHAKRRLTELRQTDQAQDCSFFEKFKTEIFARSQVDEQGEPYLLQNGKKFLLIDLIADYLQAMRKTALQDVANHTGTELDNSRIRWCLTIPAIWDDAAKQLMEQAAQKAGILKQGDWDTENFIFALEPEAAAIYCLYVADKELGIVENESTMMIVDCGGGTVDLTVHKIVREGREKGVREVVPGSGAVEGHGGKDVDKNFLDYVDAVFGAEAVETFEKQYPESYLDMLDDWENFKYGFDPDGYVRGNFRIPAELRDILQHKYPAVLEQLANVQNNNSYNLWLTREVMEEKIFGPVVNNILARIDDVFSRIGGACDYMYLVGGFATSRYLQKSIKDKFTPQVIQKILIPGEPGKSVMTGAASFARNPDIILPRKSRLTYGIASAVSGTPAELLLGEYLQDELPAELRSHYRGLKTIHDNDAQIQQLLTQAKQKADELGPAVFKKLLREKFNYDEDNDVLDLNRHFTSFIHYGDTVEKDHEVLDTFIHKSKDQHEARIEIFASEKRNVLFVDEKGVEKIGEIILKLPPLDDVQQRKIGVTMFFGDTKLKIKAKCLASGSAVESELNFLPLYRHR